MQSIALGLRHQAIARPQNLRGKAVCFAHISKSASTKIRRQQGFSGTVRSSSNGESRNAEEAEEDHSFGSQNGSQNSDASSEAEAEEDGYQR